MRTRFEEQLNMLNQEMMRMGAMIEEQIQKAVDAFLHQDTEQAEEIIKGDTDVDHMQKRIENLCFQLLMQQQPVASDLRVISAAMKMVTDMERIGDHAADISEITLMMADSPYTINMDTIKAMASETLLMLIHSVESYVEKRMDKAQKVIDHDDVVDELFDRAKKELVTEIRKGDGNAEHIIDMLIVAKYFERIGDHATNIANWVIFFLDDRKQTTDPTV